MGMWWAKGKWKRESADVGLFSVYVFIGLYVYMYMYLGTAFVYILYVFSIHVSS